MPFPFSPSSFTRAHCDQLFSLSDGINISFFYDFSIFPNSIGDLFQTFLMFFDFSMKLCFTFQKPKLFFIQNADRKFSYRHLIYKFIKTIEVYTPILD